MSAKPELIYNQIIEAIESNKLPLPSKPDIVNALQEVSKDPNAEVQDLQDIISKDPAIAARLLRLANSPIVRGKIAVNSLENAISRLGVQFVINLATGLALEQIFQTKDPQIAQFMDDAWIHSGEVAGVCSVIAAKCSRVPADQAMLAGLLHEIGILSILSWVEKNPELLQDKAFVKQLLEHDTAILSQSIMKAWAFPNELTKIPFKLHDYYENKDTADLADTLLVAKIYSLRNNPDHQLSKLEKNELPCYQRLNLDPNTPLEENEDLAEALESAKDFFK